MRRTRKNGRILGIRSHCAVCIYAHARNGCSQSSRFPTAGQGEQSYGNEIEWAFVTERWSWGTKTLGTRLVGN